MCICVCVCARKHAHESQKSGNKKTYVKVSAQAIVAALIALGNSCVSITIKSSTELEIYLTDVLIRNMENDLNNY